ncbi:DUF4326 domain-containing protein [Rhodococcus ruber]|uniref:DUF4326 domain-containing protein n=1 Tax=Rhodococcus ruber TaxID=1830 RepID=UPI003783F611
MPERIQRQRTKGWRMPDGAVYVGRPTVWGNPYRVETVGKTTHHVMHHGWICATFHSRSKTEARADAVRRLVRLIEHHRDPWGVDRIRAELAGKNLVCWCPLEDEHGNRVPCHADVLLELANGGTHA